MLAVACVGCVLWYWIRKDNAEREAEQRREEEEKRKLDEEIRQARERVEALKPVPGGGPTYNGMPVSWGLVPRSFTDPSNPQHGMSSPQLPGSMGANMLQPKSGPVEMQGMTPGGYQMGHSATTPQQHVTQ